MGELKSEGKKQRGSFRTCDSRRSVTCKMYVNCTIPHGDTEGVCCGHRMPTQASCEALLPGGEGRTFVPLITNHCHLVHSNLPVYTHVLDGLLTGY